MTDDMDVDLMLDAPLVQQAPKEKSYRSSSPDSRKRKRSRSGSGYWKDNRSSKDNDSNNRRRKYSKEISEKRERRRSSTNGRSPRDSKRSGSNERRLSRIAERESSKDRDGSVHKGSKSKDKRRRSGSRQRSKSRERRRKRSRSYRRKRSRSRDRKHSRSRERRRSRSNNTQNSRHHDSKRSRSRERRRSKSRDRRRSRSRGRGRYSRSLSPRRLREPSPDLTTVERDARTVFAWQLSARISQRDLEKFFSKIGKIRCVKLIMDNKTRKSKGIAYIEFREIEAAQKALQLTGTRLLGVPIQVQLSHAEKSRMGMLGMGKLSGYDGPLKLYVGSLHYNITEEMIRGIFEPFGTLEEVKLIRDLTTGRSQGYGFVYFANADEGKKALEQLNGFEVAGRPMRVNYVTERMEGNVSLDSDETDRAGVGLGATGRLALMAKLAEGTGLEIPKSAMPSMHQSQQVQAPPVCTQCFMLSNMFDPLTASSKLLSEIKEDVLDECSKLGGVLHIYIDNTSQNGNVYVKCASIAVATQCVNMLHGRYFSSRLITANYVPLINYHELFPESATANTVLKSTTY